MEQNSRIRPHQVFLSYSRSNRRVCQTLFHLLRDAGHEVWWDERRLQGGDFIWNNIFDRINQSSCFVVLLSDKALQSSYVEMEVSLAAERSTSGRLDAFVPVKVRPCEAEKDPRFKERVILDATRGIRRSGRKILQALPLSAQALRRPESITPHSYFDFILPALLKWYGGEVTTIDAEVYFNLYDKGGGKWTMILKPPEARVIHGKSESPDLEIHTTVGEMTNMLTGFFDAKNAIAKGRLHLAGNLEILRLVGQLFTGKKAARRETDA